MSHVLIAGQTESGKTTIARYLCQQMEQVEDIRCLIFDPIRDVSWFNVATYSTDNMEEYLETIQNSRSCGLFVDEAGEGIGQYNSEFFPIATRSRHLGHRAHFITQRPAQIAKTVRGQCSSIFLFNIDPDDAKTLSKDFNEKGLLEAPNLPQGVCLFKRRFKPLRKIDAFTMKELPL